MLVQAEETVQEFVAVTTSLTFDRIQPELQDVQENIIVRFLGNDTVEELEQAIANDTLTDHQTRLLKKVQKVICNIAVAHLLDFNAISIDDSGNHIQTNENQKTAFEWQKDLAQESLLKKGYTALDNLMVYLENYIDLYPTFLNDPTAHINQIENFIYKATDLKKYCNATNPFKVLQSLKPSFAKVEFMSLRPHLGDELYHNLKERFEAFELSTDEKHLINHYVQPAVANLALAEAITKLPFQISSGGIHLNEKDGESSSSKTSSNQQRQELKNEFDKTANFYLKEMVNYLKAKASSTVFPEFHAFYQAPEERYTADDKIYMA